jgi:cardiolipin synthase
MEDSSKKIVTVPNAICLVRILLVPVFAVLFMKGYLIAALAVLFVSGATDFFDGKIARKFNQVSDVGKWLDPLADKLTQVTLAVLLFFKFHAAAGWMHAFSFIFLVFLGKEAVMLLLSLIMLLLKKRPAAAEIYGKIATFVFYLVMAALFLAGPEVGLLQRYAPGAVLPEFWVKFMVFASLGLSVISFISYIPDTVRKLFKRRVAADNSR